MYDKNKIHQATLTLHHYGLIESAIALDNLAEGKIEEQEFRDISARELNAYVEHQKECGFVREDWEDAENYLYTVKGGVRKGAFNA